jgi:hypothetical protein
LAHSPKVFDAAAFAAAARLAVYFASIGLMPLRTSSRALLAFSRASKSDTSGKLPKPISGRRPPKEKRSSQLRASPRNVKT